MVDVEQRNKIDKWENGRFLRWKYRRLDKRRDPTEFSRWCRAKLQTFWQRTPHHSHKVWPYRRRRKSIQPTGGNRNLKNLISDPRVIKDWDHRYEISPSCEKWEKVIVKENYQRMAKRLQRGWGELKYKWRRVKLTSQTRMGKKKLEQTLRNQFKASLNWSWMEMNKKVDEVILRNSWTGICGGFNFKI